MCKDLQRHSWPLSLDLVATVGEKALRILRGDRSKCLADRFDKHLARTSCRFFLRCAFILEKASSMGEKSGE